MRGRDIKRYSYEFADLYLITTFPSLKINIEQYPAVYNFLFGFKSKLNQAGVDLTNSEQEKIILHAQNHDIKLNNKDLKKSRKKANNKWFETQDSIAYWQDFNKQKIVWKIIGSNINFFIDLEKYLYSNAANILTSNTASLETLVAFLNSRLFEWYFKKIIFIEVEGGGIQMFNTVMERIPIPIVDNEKQIYFTDLVTKISTNNDININRIINNLVYQIMSLTKDEIAFIENLQT